MNNVYDLLKERGYIAQVTNEEKVRDYLNTPGATFYIGFDPTADSLHVGHFVAMMVMAHLQRAGLKPIALLGGGTGMIGDPSGRTDLRKVMTVETICHNVNRFREQMKILVNFDDDKGVMVDNADWLLDLNYIDFIRDIGSQFTVNRMLAAEAYKQRWERGLTFLEFNYMLLQAFDYLNLFRRYDCRLELGGDDQWSNILAGTDLVRRKEGEEVFGLTFKLLTTSEGIKMGKTAKGALWLDPDRVSPYEFYQYWRNVDDADVINCLKLLTFVPMDEIRTYEKLEGAEINEAKKRLALEITRIVHGNDAAAAAAKQAAELFAGGGRSEQMPTTEIAAADLAKGLTVLDVLDCCKLIPSKAEGRRLIKQGGIRLNGRTVKTFDRALTADDFTDGEAILRRGKKVYHRLKLN